MQCVVLIDTRARPAPDNPLRVQEAEHVALDFQQVVSCALRQPAEELMLDHDPAAVCVLDAPDPFGERSDRADGWMTSAHIGCSRRAVGEAHGWLKTMIWATTLPAWLLKSGFSFMAKCRMPARSAIKS